MPGQTHTHGAGMQVVDLPDRGLGCRRGGQIDPPHPRWQRGGELFAAASTWRLTTDYLPACQP